MEDMSPAHPSDALMDEATLLAKMLAGEQFAFEACVRAYCTQMLAVARRILRQEEDAQDAVQEAFLAAFKDLARFQGNSLLSTWLHRIVVNAALTRLRSRQRRPEQSIEALLPHFSDDEHQIESPVLWRDISETSGQGLEARELVQRCIGQLPEIYRTVLLLRDIEGLDTEETARLLDTSTGVVKTRLHRARQALRTLLDPYYRGGDV